MTIRCRSIHLALCPTFPSSLLHLVPRPTTVLPPPHLPGSALVVGPRRIERYWTPQGLTPVTRECWVVRMNLNPISCVCEAFLHLQALYGHRQTYRLRCLRTRRCFHYQYVFIFDIREKDYVSSRLITFGMKGYQTSPTNALRTAPQISEYSAIAGANDDRLP